MLGNIHRDRKKHPKPFTRGDVLPGLKPETDEDPNAGLFNHLRALKKNG